MFPRPVSVFFLLLLSILAQPLRAHQGGSHPTNLPLAEEAVIALEGFSLFGAGVVGSRNQDFFEPQEYRLVNLAGPEELPYSVANISLVLGDEHQSTYNDYTIRVVLPTGVQEFNGSSFPGEWGISPILHGWSGTLIVFATNNVGNFTLQATATWNLARPEWERAPCDPCGDITCTSFANIGSVKLSVPLGILQYGHEPASLLYDEEQLANQGAAALDLAANRGNHGPIVQQDANKVLTSVQCGDHLARITTEPTPADPARFVVRVSSDPADPDNTIFREAIVENLTLPGGEPALCFTETVAGKSTVRIYTRPDPATWILEEAGMRRTTKTVLSENATTRVTRWQNDEKNAAGAWATVALREDHETKFQWGWSLTRRILDPDGQAVTSAWDYYDFGEATGPNGDTFGHGRLKCETLPTGMVRTYQYLDTDPYNSGFTHLEIVREAYASNGLALEKRRHLAATGSAVDELHETWIAGNLVEKTEVVARSGGGANWREEKRYPDPTSPPLVTRVDLDQWASNPLFQKTTFPDGTIEQINIVLSGGMKTVTTYRGVRNPGGGRPIVTGQETVAVLNELGQVVQRETCEVRSGTVYPAEMQLATQFDAVGRPTAYETFHSGTATPTYTATRQFGCCGLAEQQGQDEIPVSYYYDDLSRLRKMHRNGLATETVYDGLTTRTHLYPEAVPSSLSFATAANEAGTVTRNLAGDIVAEATRAPHDGSLVTTTYATTYDPGGGIGRRVVQTWPLTPDDGGIVPTITEEFYLDGRLNQRRGTPVVDRVFNYGFNPTGLTTTVALVDQFFVARQAVVTQLDWMGRALKITYSGDADGDSNPDEEHFEYDHAGRLVKEVDPDGVTLLTEYDPATETTTRALDRNRNGLIDPDLDEVRITRSGVLVNGVGDLLRWSEVAVRDTDSGGNPVERILSRRETTADLLDSATHLYSGGVAATTRQSTTFLPGQPGAWDSTLTNPDGTSTTRQFRGGLLAGESLTAADATALLARTFTYDSSQRLIGLTDTSGPDLAQSYVSPLLAFPATVTRGTRTTHYAYDARGRRVLIDEPDTVDHNGQPVANQQVITYEPHDGVREVTGTPGYRRSFTYDFSHRPATLTTYGTTQTTTRWEYDLDRGFLTGKRYDSPLPGAGAGESYSYTAAGRLAQRLSARGIATNYARGTDGRLTSLTYSDATPAVVIDQRDRLGRVSQITDATGTRALTYNDQGTLTSTAYQPGALLAGWTVAPSHDPLQRLSALELQNGAAVPHRITYSYDSAGRPASVDAGNLVAHYHYDPARQLVSQLSIVDAQRPLHFATRQYDDLNRLTRITWHNGNPQGQFLAHSDYHYQRDDFGRITHATLRDGTQWRYAYNPSGELAAAARHLTETSPDHLAGQSFAWSYDGIGNRTSSSRGGDRTGANLRTTNYSSNPLNQLTSRQSPGAADITGAAPLAPDVLVNGSPAARQGSFFRFELTADNSSSPVWQPVSVSQGAASKSGALLLPPATASYQYDPDGNLTSDGVHQYNWDAENRLTRIETLPASVTAGVPYQRVEYTYDSDSRRLQRLLYDQPAPAPPVQTTRYLYAGWRCLAELDHTDTLQRTFTWGLDNHDALHLGDSNGALLWLHDHNANETHLTTSDGNGNITGLLSAQSRQPTATYTYSPFGQLLTSTGPYADENPYRFSTKPLEPATNTYNYGYRHYNPTTGTWLNRDPIAEDGGMNVYGFVGNGPIGSHDVLGLRSFWEKAYQQFAGAREAVSAVAKYVFVEFPTNVAKVGVAAIKAIPGAVNAGVTGIVNEAFYAFHPAYDYGQIWQGRVDGVREFTEELEDRLAMDFSDPNYLENLLVEVGNLDPDCVEAFIKKAHAEAALGALTAGSSRALQASRIANTPISRFLPGLNAKTPSPKPAITPPAIPRATPRASPAASSHPRVVGSFDEFASSRGLAGREADKAWEVYQRAANSKGIMLGHGNTPIQKSGNGIYAMRFLDGDYTHEVNKALIDGALDSGRPVFLGTPFDEIVRGSPLWDEVTYVRSRGGSLTWR